MKFSKRIITKILAHPAWSGVGVLVAAFALTASIIQSYSKAPEKQVEIPTKPEKIKTVKESPIFVSQRIALVIGNSEYNLDQRIEAVRGIRISSKTYTPSIPILNTISALKNPVNDADAVASLLKGKGFKIIKGLNVTKAELKDLVDKFQTLLSAGGVGLFYYAGHAITIGENDYLLPVNAKDVSTEKKYISEAVNITEILQPVEKLIEDHPKDTGSIVVYSASRGHAAFDGVGSNSPFTIAFLSAVEKGDSNTGIFDIFINTAKETARETNEAQVPWISGTSYSNFYFNDRISDKNISLMKILFIDACRDNPFRTNSR